VDPTRADSEQITATERLCRHVHTNTSISNTNNDTSFAMRHVYNDDIESQIGKTAVFGAKQETCGWLIHFTSASASYRIII